MPLNFIAHADTMVKQEDTYAYSKKSTYLPNSKLNWCYSYTLQNHNESSFAEFIVIIISISGNNSIYITIGECVCNMCFTRNSSGLCELCSDYRYSSSQGICGVDNRPRQLTAFLLSLFLSSTGAANFYIGRNELGKIDIKVNTVIYVF